MIAEKNYAKIAAGVLHRAESIVLVLIAVVLIVLAALLLANSALGLVRLLDLHDGADLRTLAVDILDTVLLVMMTMEIVYTVAVSLESHTVVAEPFLIIGAIAAIRRMLVITAEGTKVGEDMTKFAPILLELALLAAIVLAMAVSVYVLRRSQRFLGPGGQPQAE